MKEWRVIKMEFPEGVRYLLQRLYTDASEPYYLTRRILKHRSKALKALEQKRKEL